MAKRTLTPWAFLALAGSLVSLLPLTGTAAATSTWCEGGATDPWAVRMSPSSMSLYVSLEDGTVWKDANGVPGIQRTARLCYDLDDDHRVVNSYQEFAGDERVR